MLIFRQHRLYGYSPLRRFSYGAARPCPSPLPPHATLCRAPSPRPPPHGDLARLPTPPALALASASRHLTRPRSRPGWPPPRLPPSSPQPPTTPLASVVASSTHLAACRGRPGRQPPRWLPRTGSGAMTTPAVNSSEFHPLLRTDLTGIMPPWCKNDSATRPQARPGR